MTNSLTKTGFQKFTLPLTLPVAQKIQDLLRVVFRRRKLLVWLIGFLVLALIVVAILALSSFRKDNLVNVQQSVKIGRTVEFPIRNSQDRVIKDRLKMTFTSAEKANKILIKAQPATARKGKAFLIINIELDNPTKNKLNLAPVKLIRLVDNSGKNFAPDIHNDQVLVEPISVKKTRVGFVVDEVASSWKLQIGEVDGKKEILELVI